MAIRTFTDLEIQGQKILTQLEKGVITKSDVIEWFYTRVAELLQSSE